MDQMWRTSYFPDFCTIHIQSPPVPTNSTTKMGCVLWLISFKLLILPTTRIQNKCKCRLTLITGKVRTMPGGYMYWERNPLRFTSSTFLWQDYTLSICWVGVPSPIQNSAKSSLALKLVWTTSSSFITIDCKVPQSPLISMWIVSKNMSAWYEVHTWV